MKTYEISVSIRKYPQISIYFLDIHFSEYMYFSETKQIKKLDIRISKKIRYPDTKKITNTFKNPDIRSVPRPI